MMEVRVAEAFRRKSPVIRLDRRVLGSEFTTFVGADNSQVGLAAGQWVARKPNKRGRVALPKKLRTSIVPTIKQTHYRDAQAR
jgi:ribose transport system substrate-binding protein